MKIPSGVNQHCKSIKSFSMPTCPNCNQNFEITDQDLEFYQKMKVPSPTLCPDCRQQRRLAFRNERNLYRNRCALCKKEMITIYSPDKPYPVYCSNCWWGDNWDAMEYGRDFDFNRPFFDQWKELWDEVPKLALIIVGENIGSDYTHDNYRLKNCYLTFDGEQAQDCYYGETFSHLKDSVDFLFIQHSELLYECINCVNCYNLKFSRFSYNCSNSAFLVDCVGCKNCLGCTNLHRAQYHIFNKPYSKEEYEKKIKTFNLQNYPDSQKFKEKFEKFCGTQIKKVLRGKMNENVTGDNLMECKNVFESYNCRGLRDCKFCTNMIMGANDCYDVNIWGDKLSSVYNSACVGAGGQNIIASYYAGFDGSNIYHSAFCWRNAHDIFGSVGLRQKRNCILNKQYSEEEYEKLTAQIIEHMLARQSSQSDDGKKGNEYAEFFPIPLSAFGYNETVAQEYYPMTKEEAEGRGYKWRDENDTSVPRHGGVQRDQIPNSIKDTPDSITNEILSCEHCGKNYKIIPQELKFYREMNIPIPHNCPDCRHKARMQQRNPCKLYKRTCAKCNTEIQTTYAPDRTEIIYCERCYLDTIM